MKTFQGTMKEKIKRIRIKVINLRRQLRMKYFKNLKKLEK